MIHINNFDTAYAGREFVDTSIGVRTQYVCVGYGDNGSNGNPYLVGLSATSNGAVLKTVLFKNVEFVPSQTKP